MRLGGAPVPIPNTPVKAQTADGTMPRGMGEQVAAGTLIRLFYTGFASDQRVKNILLSDD